MTEITMETKDWILLGHYLHSYLEGKELQNHIVKIEIFHFRLVIVHGNAKLTWHSYWVSVKLVIFSLLLAQI